MERNKFSFDQSHQLSNIYSKFTIDVTLTRNEFLFPSTQSIHVYFL